MDKIAELSTHCRLDDCCRAILWDAVENVASVILARYTACGCPPWAGMRMSHGDTEVMIRADFMDCFRSHCSIDVHIIALRGFHEHEAELIDRYCMPGRDRSRRFFRPAEAQLFGNILYDRFHGLPVHSECITADFQPALPPATDPGVT